MKLKIAIISFIVFLFAFGSKESNTLPEGFVYAKTVISDLDVELRYFSSNNFVGDTIDGYKANVLILTKETANALQKVQHDLQQQNL